MKSGDIDLKYNLKKKEKNIYFSGPSCSLSLMEAAEAAHGELRYSNKREERMDLMLSPADGTKNAPQMGPTSQLILLSKQPVEHILHFSSFVLP